MSQDQMLSVTLATLSEQIKSLDEKVERIDHTIRGNGNPGLATRIDRLEQTEERRTWAGRTMIGALFALIAERIHAWLT